MEGTYTAVLDRFEATADGEERAVLLLEADGEVVDDLVVAPEQLPAEGRHRDAVFELSVTDDGVRAAYRPDETETRREAAQSRFDRLSRRPPERGDEEDG